jgi:hypothetical protein
MITQVADGPIIQGINSGLLIVMTSLAAAALGFLLAKVRVAGMLWQEKERLPWRAKAKLASFVGQDGGGVLVNISVDDLVGDKVAITQLMNDRTIHVRKLEIAKRQLADKASEVDFLKTAPFVSVLALVFSAIGTIVMSIGIRMLTSTPTAEYATLLTICGAGTILASGVANILYPYARRFFNKHKS